MQRGRESLPAPARARVAGSTPVGGAQEDIRDEETREMDEYKAGDKVVILPHERDFHFLDPGTVAEVVGYWGGRTLRFEVIGKSTHHGDDACSQVVREEHIRPLRIGELVQP
jgi:hypothetical protein